MTIQSPEQEICKVEGDTVTVLLPNTTLILSMEEANSLNCILQTDLIHDFCEVVHGKGESETICIADVPVLRDEAWELHRILDNIIDLDDEVVVDEEDWIQESVSSYDRVNWLESGF